MGEWTPSVSPVPKSDKAAMCLKSPEYLCTEALFLTLLSRPIMPAYRFNRRTLINRYDA